MAKNPDKQEAWVWKTPWRRKWQPTLVFLPGKPHGPRCLAGYSLQTVRYNLAIKQQPQHKTLKSHQSLLRSHEKMLTASSVVRGRITGVAHHSSFLHSEIILRLSQRCYGEFQGTASLDNYPLDSQAFTQFMRRRGKNSITCPSIIWVTAPILSHTHGEEERTALASHADTPSYILTEI